MNERIMNIARCLSDSPVKQLEMYRKVHLINEIVKNKGKNIGNIGVIPSNGYYGHEYWIKKYAGWNRPIYSLIEHGLYMGRNSMKVGDTIEYELKSILTYSDYREDVMKDVFPDTRIYKIGPRIAYVPTDLDYYKELNHPGEKVLTLFPAHSLTTIKMKYDEEYLMGEAERVREQKGLDRIRVCLPYPDIQNGTSRSFEERGYQIVTGGDQAVNFLPRLRAIIESSELTMSNCLGTNLGYCIYLNKQQVLIKQDIEFNGSEGALNLENRGKSDNHTTDFDREKDIFKEIFSASTNEITEEQKQICDYYFGYQYVRTPSEMKEILAQEYDAAKKK